MLQPTRGRVAGWAGTVAPVLLGLAFVIGDPGLGSVRTLAGLGLFAAVIWVNLLRPRIELDGTTIRFVNAFRDIEVPAALVEHVTVRNFVAVEAGGRKYTGASVGHSTRALLRGDADRARGLVLEPGRTPLVENQAVYVRDRLEQLADAARREQRATGREPGPVRKTWARTPLALTVALVLAVVLLNLL